MSGSISEGKLTYQEKVDMMMDFVKHVMDGQEVEPWGRPESEGQGYIIKSGDDSPKRGYLLIMPSALSGCINVLIKLDNI